MTIKDPATAGQHNNAHPNVTNFEREALRRDLDAKAKELALADLARSGLTESHAAIMGIRPQTPSETKKECGLYAYSYDIPYFNPANKSAWAGRRRMLEKPKDWKDDGDYRYHQVAGTPPHLYFYPDMKWEKLNLLQILLQPQAPLLITEGEKKAAKACVEGLPCIGLGGVWNWKSKKREWLMLPDFQLVNWINRQVTICFDSDVKTNANVRQAREELAERLAELGALVHVIDLPDLGNGKTGLDDYLVAKSAREFSALPSERIDSALHELNARFVRCENPNAVFDLEESIYLNRSDFAKCNASRPILTIDWKGKKKERHSGEVWLDWPGRRQARRAVFRPGNENRLIEEGGLTLLNEWAGFGVKPVKNDELIDLYLQFFSHLTGEFSDYKDDYGQVVTSADEQREWLLSWFLFPMREPGVKLRNSAMMWSPEEGVGKSFQGDIIRAVYGKHGRVITPQDLESDFNEATVNALFTMVEEMQSGKSRQWMAGKLRHLITSPEIRVNQKYVPSYEIDNCNQFYFTTNQLDPMWLSKLDRRYFIGRAPNAPWGVSEYKALGRHLESGELPSAILYYAQNDFKNELFEFDPNAKPPMTMAKQTMINASGGQA